MKTFFVESVVPTLLAGLLAMTVGCGVEKTQTPSEPTIPSSPSTPAPPVPSLLLSGKVLAGTQPIVGAGVQVFSAGTSGNGSGATPQLSTPVTTDSNGEFAMTTGLSCNKAAPMVYVVARGGRVGSGAANAAIALAAAIGNCDKLSTTSSSSFTINEVTTVGFAWALSQFLSHGAVVGSTSTNATGLANAFATALNLADSTRGTSPGIGFPSTGRAPVAKINTLANLLNRCTSTANACAALFSAATVGGSPAPSDTLDTAFNLARHPGSNVVVLSTQAAASTAFSPALSNPPSDWTLSLSFTGAGMNAPTGVGIDSRGNVWVASFNGVASKFSPTGTAVFDHGITGNGLQSSFGLAIDAQNNVWIPNEDSPKTVNSGYGSITVLNSDGQPVSGVSGYTAGGISYPVALSIDPNGNVWVANFRNSRITLLSSNGAALSGSNGYTAASLAFIVSTAVDSNHNLWIGNQNDSTITRLSSDGGKSLGVSCCSGAQGLAIDQRGYIWASNFYSDSVSQIAADGTVVSPGYSAPGLSRPQGIAVDGAGSVWAASFRSSGTAPSATLMQFAGSGASAPGALVSPSSGWLADAAMIQPYAIAIDASGNIWITNFTNDSSYKNSNSIIELVGMAAPVKTPLLGPPQTP